MEFRRTENATKTFAFGVISKIVSILCPFVIRTIIIYKLGADYVGLSSLFSSVLTLLSVSELGIASAISFCLYKPVAEDNRKVVSALMALMRKLYLCIGVFITILGISLMPFLNHFISSTPPSDINIYILFAIYLINTVSSYYGFAYKSVLFEAYQQGYINHRINTIIELIKDLVQILVLLCFPNYYAYVAILPIATIAINILTEIESKKKFPDIVPSGSVDQETKNIIKNKVLFLSLHSVASKLTMSIDNIVISGSLGLTAIAIFGNYQYIYASVISFITLAYQALKPVVGNSYYRDSAEQKLQIFSALRLASVWGTAWCSACLLCLFQPFITLWVGRKYLVSFTTVILFVAYFFSNASRQFFTSIYVEMAGLWNKTLLRQIIAAGANLILDVFLVDKYGIAGIVFASFFTNMFIAFPLDLYVTYKNVLKTSILNGIIRSFKEIILTILICVVTFYSCNLITTEGVLGFACKFIICLVIPNLIMLLLYFRKSEFKYLYSHFLSMVYHH